VLGIVLTLAGFTVGESLGLASAGVMLLVLFLLEWFYYILFEVVWSGRTPGKRAMSLRVIGEGGQPLTLGQSILRNLLRAADLLPSAAAFPTYAIGVLVMSKDARFRRLGDLAAGTIVIVEKRSAVDAPLVIHPMPSPQELANLPQRLPIDGDELEGIELLLRREYKLSPARTYELASIVAGIFADRLHVRVNDPVRFLKVLYARARGMTATVNQDAAYRPRGGGPGAHQAPPWAVQPPGYGGFAPGPGGYPYPGPPPFGSGGYGAPGGGYGPQGYGPPGQGLAGYGPQAGGRGPR
jgi:uncharacterized RDD family membrane protein YckC